LMNFTDIIKAFVTGITHSVVSRVGAIMASVIFPVLLTATMLDMQGIIHNPYFGFVLYMVLGPLFILSLVLIFAGLFFFKGKEGVGYFTYEYLKEQFSAPERFIRVRKLIVICTALSVINIAIIVLISYEGYHFMESEDFCGGICHTAMAPEHTAYLNSPHSSVRCVECHIGPGAQWFIKSKISGARQLVAVALGNFSRPIATPIHGLRPARETCEECHRPELFHGEKLYIKDKYLPDEQNTNVQTVLLMKVGSGGYRGSKANGIHWHVAPENKITYKHQDKGRLEISEVTLAKPNGTMVDFKAPGADEAEEAKETGHQERIMDCLDCHNRPTHIYLSPNEALDLKLNHGDIPLELPYIKKQGLAVISKDYKSSEEAKNNIATELRAWYLQNYPDVVKNNMELLDKAIAGVQAAYAENVFPEMNINWNTYTNFLGHKNDSGCFRCHDESHETSSGETISQDCDKCHIILAEDEPAPEVLKTLRGSNN